MLGDGTDCDVIALAEDQLEAAVQVFYVRGGRVRGQRGWVVDKIEDIATGDLVEHFLGQVYGDDRRRAAPPRPARRRPRPRRATGRPGAAGLSGAVPREVLVPVLPPDAAVVEEWLAARRGGRVSLRVPRRGDKKALLDTVARNAAESLVQHKTRRASDLTTRSRAMHEIQEALGLDEAPLRIECYDVSNLQGTHVVASMIVFEDGLPRSPSTAGSASTAWTAPTTWPRSTGHLPAGSAVTWRNSRRPASWTRSARSRTAAAKSPGRPRKFAYPPNLVVIDGGPAQVAAAVRALDELGIDDVAVCGLAKRLEEVGCPARMAR